MLATRVQKSERDAQLTVCPIRKRPPEELPYCLGSACAWWVWTFDPPPTFRVCDDPVATSEPEKKPVHVGADWRWVPFDPADGEPGGWAEPEESQLARRKGVCGHLLKIDA